MELVTLDEFIADIETTFANYAATNDIDRNSIKGWVTECLRKFGKNICDKRETIVTIKNSRGNLPETFKSMILGLKLTSEEDLNKKSDKRLIVEKQKIENPAYWSDATQDYFVNYCESTISTEKIYTHYEHEDRCYNYEWLSLVPGMKSDTIATNCLNLHPSIRNTYPNKIAITARSINCNFKEGSIYFQYNSLPMIDNEIAIPIFSTGDIEKYIKNYIKIQLSEALIINDKNPQTLTSLMSAWMQKDRELFILAKSEANWSNLTKSNWANNTYKNNRLAQEKYNLPK